MNRSQQNTGQTLIEFALILPLVLFLMLGFFDLGRAIFYYSSLTNAVREGTRYAIVNKDALIDFENGGDILKNKVLEFAFGLTNVPNPITVDNIEVEIDKITRNQQVFYNTVSIEVNYLFRPITPGIKEIFGTSEGIALIAQSQMYVTPASR